MRNVMLQRYLVFYVTWIAAWRRVSAAMSISHRISVTCLQSHSWCEHVCRCLLDSARM